MDAQELWTLQRQLRALIRRQRREGVPVEGMTRLNLRVLGAVARGKGQAQPRLLAEELVMTSSNVAAALRDLEARGLVTRRKDEEDSRRVNVALTEEGARVVHESRAVRVGWLGEAIEALLTEEEQRTMLEAGRLMERLSGYEPPSTPTRDAGRARQAKGGDDA
jgi:DNA-binding MarR family transcriptional regulator